MKFDDLRADIDARFVANNLADELKRNFKAIKAQPKAEDELFATIDAAWQKYKVNHPQVNCQTSAPTSALAR
jgi:hypothetical protein